MIEKKRREKRSILYILMIIMGTNTTTMKKKRSNTNAGKFSFIRQQEKKTIVHWKHQRKKYIIEKFYVFNTFIYISMLNAKTIIDIERHISPL
jgi:hypothetical protein